MGNRRGCLGAPRAEQVCLAPSLCVPWCLPGSSVQWARVRMEYGGMKGGRRQGAAETPWGELRTSRPGQVKRWEAS